MSELVHVVCAALRAEIDAEPMRTARALAFELIEAPSTVAVVVAESSTHLLVATWLESRDALEAFAASPAHMAFIMRGVARVTAGMWSAAVETDGRPPSESEPAGALFVFGLRGRVDGPQLYEWEVRALLESIAALPGVTAAGLTFEERDRFRAAGVVVIPAGESAAFTEALAAAEARSGEAARFVDSALAPVVGLRRPAR